MASGVLVRQKPPCSGKFAWLGNHPSLANRTDGSVEVGKVLVLFFEVTLVTKSI